MMFFVKMVNSKVVENLCIYIVLKFHSNGLNGLSVMAVGIWSSEVLALWNFWTDLETCFV